MPTDVSSHRLTAVSLATLVVIGLVLRLIGIDYGLPAVYNPDEVAILNRALAFAAGDLNPHNFVYPTLYFYALFAWEALAFAAGWVAGVWDSVAAFEREFFVDPTRLYLAGRALSALCGAATVWAVYRLGSRCYGRTAGVAAAALLAAAPIAVRDAHYVKHDVPVTLLIVLAITTTAGLVVDPERRRKTRGWLLAGALAGVAMSTHYYAIFTALPIGLAALVLGPDAGEPWSTRVRWVAAAGAAAAAAFVAGSPFLVADVGTFWRDAVANREIVLDRATAETGAFGTLGRYATLLTTDALGRGAFLISLAGVMTAFSSGWRRTVVLLSFPIPFLLFLGNTVPATRYLNPILPFAAVLGGSALAWLAGRGRLGVVLAALIGLTAIGEAGLASARANAFIRETDTRTQALEYIERAIPPGASLLVQPYSVPLRPSRAAMVEALRVHLGTETAASTKFQRLLALDPYPAPAYRTIYLGTGGLDVDKVYVAPSAFEGDAGVAPLRALSVEFVVLKRYNVPDPALGALDAALEREARLIATFSPYRAGVDSGRRAAVAPFLHNTDASIDPALERPGPAIEIWRIN
jgi:hypothetical protein